ncbi:MAG TPA: glutamyl-tRNA reductase [Acidobacteriota bacterium]|nr:glutamyl-tRNA reductase [Acidobacteriota bacterium]
MDLVLVGLSHRTAPIEVREKVTFPEGRLRPALLNLVQACESNEAMIVSTCNRVELITDGARNGSVERVKEFLYSYHALQPPFLEKHIYVYREEELVRHVFRVASSLDSMVLGEAQILGQLKRAFLLADTEGITGRSLKRLIPHAFFVAKRVRTETQIASSAVSVSSVAVELARKIFADLRGKTALLLGAGKMSELAAKSFMKSGVERVLVANRSPDRSQKLAARFGGTAVPYCEVDRYLLHADIVLVSTNADSFLIRRSQMEEVIWKRKYSPIFLIDISVPRNVDPTVNEIENIFLYDIDDLQSVSSSNMEERTQEAALAEQIIDEEVANYLHYRSTQNLGPVMQRLQKRLEEICLEELHKSQNLFRPEDRLRMEEILRRTAKKLAHPVMVELKRPGITPSQRLQNLEMIKKIFDLDEDG